MAVTSECDVVCVMGTMEGMMLNKPDPLVWLLLNTVRMNLHAPM
jgi:hypothetical protein